MRRELLAITPAAHYSMGGIKTDKFSNKYKENNAYACGECAQSFIHGANRLKCFVGNCNFCGKIAGKVNQTKTAYRQKYCKSGIDKK